MTTNTPEIISDKQILQRASEQGERVTRVQVIRCGDKLSEISFWHHANGRLARVTSREVGNI